MKPWYMLSLQDLMKPRHVVKWNSEIQRLFEEERELEKLQVYTIGLGFEVLLSALGASLH